MKCPICGREFDLNAPDTAMPFCSIRCKQIDLKRWLDEEYTYFSDKPEEDQQTAEGFKTDENH
ncbi:MAG: DNA gyrase inhibitor YacG [Thermoguttaceae bacterium]|nr:DNA gyrase inhibitor YacG [Thermoguttaceae bacterium]